MASPSPAPGRARSTGGPDLLLGAGLGAALQCLGTDLVPAARATGLRELLLQAPVPVAAWGLELRLQGGAQALDLGAALRPGAAAAAALPRLAELSDPRSRPLELLAETWAPGAPLGPRAAPGRTFLEWDLPAEQGRPAPPGLFLEPGEEAGGEAAAAALLLQLGARPHAGDLGAEVQALTAALPRGCRVHWLGWMPARGSGALRACVQCPSPGLLLALRALRLVPEDAERRRLLAGALRRAGGSVDLQLELPLQPDAGFDLEVALPGDPGTAAGWSLLMGWLLEEGLAEPSPMAAAWRWAGREPPPAEGGLGLRRYLSHLKLRLRPGRPAAAKAYLMVEPLG